MATMKEIGFKIVLFFGIFATATISIFTVFSGDSYNHVTAKGHVSYSQVSWRELLPEASLVNRACTLGVQDARQMDDYLPQLIICEADTPDQASPRTDHNMINGTFTKKLWSFKEPMSELIYMYEQTLQKNWQRNRTNAEKFRSELANYHEVFRRNLRIIASKKNVKFGISMRYPGSAATRVTREIYNSLPETNPLPGTGNYKSCAVIGNSGSLLGSGCGEEIDSHDFVIRCNLASIPPFKHDAGAQTNLTTMNPSILRIRYGGLKTQKAKQKLREDLSAFNGAMWIPGSFENSLAIYKIMNGIKNPQIISPYPDHVRYVLQFWKDRSLQRWLSTGFYLMTLAAQLCENISLYGFWPFSYRFDDIQKVPVKYHYFDNTTNEEARAHHSMDKEFNILLQLHHAGVLRLHVGRCGNRGKH